MTRPKSNLVKRPKFGPDCSQEAVERRRKMRAEAHAAMVGKTKNTSNGQDFADFTISSTSELEEFYTAMLACISQGRAFDVLVMAVKP